jgi:hypothetical protein
VHTIGSTGNKSRLLLSGEYYEVQAYHNQKFKQENQSIATHHITVLLNLKRTSTNVLVSITGQTTLTELAQNLHKVHQLMSMSTPMATYKE